MDKPIGRNFSSSYLYGKTNYEKNIFNFIMSGDEIDKESTAFEDIIFFTQIGENVTNELKNLNELVGKLKASQDIKESANTQAAINSKIASLQAQKIQLDLYEAQRNKREELINMQKKAEAKKAWTTPSSLKF